MYSIFTRKDISLVEKLQIYAFSLFLIESCQEFDQDYMTCINITGYRKLQFFIHSICDCKRLGLRLAQIHGFNYSNLFLKGNEMYIVN